MPIIDKPLRPVFHGSNAHTAESVGVHIRTAGPALFNRLNAWHEAFIEKAVEAQQVRSPRDMGFLFCVVLEAYYKTDFEEQPKYWHESKTWKWCKEVMDGDDLAAFAYEWVCGLHQRWDQHYNGTETNPGIHA